MATDSAYGAPSDHAAMYGPVADWATDLDHADPAYHAGWSVVGRGQAVGMDERFVDGAAVDELSHLLSRPWGFDLPAGWVGIRFDELTGRRIVPLARTAGDWG